MREGPGWRLRANWSTQLAWPTWVGLTLGSPLMGGVMKWDPQKMDAVRLGLNCPHKQQQIFLIFSYGYGD
jgi:hypothetical protein